jgi:hypothetical protein
MLEEAKGFLKKLKSKMFFLFGKFQDFANDIKEKFKNLYQTNYNTGMYHFEHGNIWDAALRFKIIKKFWPDKLEAQYQYALCLILKGMDNDANALLHDILKKNQNYSQAQNLLDDLESGKTQQMVKEYETKFNENNNEKAEKN